MEKFRIVVEFEDEGNRIDKYLSSVLEDLTRTKIQNLIKDEKILVNDLVVSSSYKVKEDDEIIVNVPKIKPMTLEAENIPLDIIYEDDDLLVVNKQKGLVVHPASGNHTGTLVNALLYHFKDKYVLVNWIFYVDFLTNMGGKNFENEWDVLVAVCNIFYQNKAFYQSALRIEGQNSFKDYFYEMLEPVMAFFVQDLFQVQNQKLFVTFFCDAFLTAVLRWFSMESELEPETFVEELKEVIYRSSEKIAAKAEPKK